MHFYDLFFYENLYFGNKKDCMKRLQKIRYVILVQKPSSSSSSSDGKGWKIKWKTWKCFRFRVWVRVRPAVCGIDSSWQLSPKWTWSHIGISVNQMLLNRVFRHNRIKIKCTYIYTAKRNETKRNEIKWHRPCPKEERTQKITTTSPKRNKNTELEMRWVWCQGWHTHIRTGTRWHNINQELNNSLPLSSLCPPTIRSMRNLLHATLLLFKIMLTAPHIELYCVPSQQAKILSGCCTFLSVLACCFFTHSFSVFDLDSNSGSHSNSIEQMLSTMRRVFTFYFHIMTRKSWTIWTSCLSHSGHCIHSLA